MNKKNIYPIIFHFLSKARIHSNDKINKLFAKPIGYKEQRFGIGGPKILTDFSLKRQIREIHLKVRF